MFIKNRKGDGYKTLKFLSAACQQHAREKRQKETPLATSSAVSSVHPQSENAEVHLKSVIQSVSLPAAASARKPSTLNTIFDPSSKLLMNFLLVLMSNKKCIKYVSFVCLLSQEGAILISPTQHNTIPKL